MTTTLRRDRRTQRTAKFNLESLDDRIVPSAMGAEAAVERAALVHERQEVRIARHEAPVAQHQSQHGARLHRLEIKHSGMQPASSVAITTNASVSSSTPTSTVPTSTTGGSAPVSTTFSPLLQTTSTGGTSPATTTSSTGSNANASTTSSTPLPPNASAPLQSLYQQYEAFASSGGSGTFSPTGVNGVVIDGTNVGINFQIPNGADFSSILSQLQSDGLQVTASSATYGLIEGMVPIAQLPVVAEISSSASVTAMYQPVSL
jgi:hypothetical protein